MNWYTQKRESDSFVLNDQVAFEAPSTEERSHLPSDWCQWGYIRPEKMESPAINEATSIKSTVDEFVFDRQCLYAQVSKGPFVHEGEASSSCVWREPPVNCNSRPLEAPVLGQPDLQMQNNMDWMDEVFLNSLLEDDNGITQNTSQSQNMPDSISRSQSFENFMANMLSDPQCPVKDSATRETLVATNNNPYLSNDMSESWAKMEDSSSSFLAVEEYGRSEGPVTDPALLMPAELSASNRSETYGDEPKCWEATVLQELEDITINLSDNMRMCFRDALYRLAKNSKDQHAISQSKNANSMEVKNESTRLGGSHYGESRTNVVDRTIANLMFNKPYFHAQEAPCRPGSFHRSAGDRASLGSCYSQKCYYNLNIT